MSLLPPKISKTTDQSAFSIINFFVFVFFADESQAGDDRFSQFRSPVFQQSVTLTAKMWPPEVRGKSH